MNNLGKQSNILITGICGFIGSHMARQLTRLGYNVYGVDRIYRHEQICEDIFYGLDLTADNAVVELTDLLNKYKINIVIHLAALIQVGEGEQKPDLYYLNNVDGTKNVLEAMRIAGVKQLIFSSTAAVYKPVDMTDDDGDELKSDPISISPRHTDHNKYRDLMMPPVSILKRTLKETDPVDPISVYGKTKLRCEQIIKNYCDNYSFQAVIFRFFNVAGGKEIYKKPIHLIPILVQKIFMKETFTIFGKNYPTRDGTCYRDYLHVDDLIEAAVSAIKRWDRLVFMHGYNNIGDNLLSTMLTEQVTIINDSNTNGDSPITVDQSEKNEEDIVLQNSDTNLNDEEVCKILGDPDVESSLFRVYNLGMGICFSVLQVYAQVGSHYQVDYADPDEKCRFGFEFKDRRQGDPPLLLANVMRAQIELEWSAKKCLDAIITDTIRNMS